MEVPAYHVRYRLELMREDEHLDALLGTGQIDVRKIAADRHDNHAVYCRDELIHERKRLSISTV